MSIKEIVGRIDFINKVNQDKTKSELKHKFSILHNTIASASNLSKRNNAKFSQYLEKLFSNKDKIEDGDNSLEDIMNLVNKGNVKK